jgi:hypothetical protein
MIQDARSHEIKIWDLVIPSITNKMQRYTIYLFMWAFHRNKLCNVSYCWLYLENYLRCSDKWTSKFSNFSFNFQYLSFPSYLLLRPLFPSLLHSVTCFRSQFLRNKKLMQLALVHLIIHRIVLFSWPSSLFPQSIQTPSFSSTTFQGVSDLWSEVSRFRHHTKLYSNAVFYQFIPWI